VHEDGRRVVVFAGGGSGGHLYPALAISDALCSLLPDVRPVFVGARRGVEARVLPERGLEHVLLPVRGLDRSRPWANLGVLVDLARSVFAVARLFRSLAPEVVVVTGGYAGAPAGMVAVPMGIPLVLQEANSAPGLTTRRLAGRARTIHLAFPEARDLLPTSARDRAVVSGNPIRPPRDIDRAEARRSFGLAGEATVVLVVGGSQGSLAINERVLGALTAVAKGELGRPSGVEILWATGPKHFERVARELAGLGELPWVHAVDYIDRMPEALAAADLAVSRAGAMTTSELQAWGIPAILVPLPTAAADHQTLNARVLDEAGVAIHLAEAGLESTALWNVMTALAADPDRRADMAARARARGRPDAAREIAGSIAAMLDPPASSSGRRSPAGGTGTPGYGTGDRR
jgi:UDP-N-acetylglucosamine--N-acetylmuramyl-(pentapeptide) pyrophosphoryl-undecaprenol N-acetylglucosamine transferase